MAFETWLAFVAASMGFCDSRADNPARRFYALGQGWRAALPTASGWRWAISRP